jgi:dTDP-3-amino-3,4,6-trideoxy-alpha-D-glucose transaminase
VSVPFLDLSRRVAARRAELDGALARVLDSGRFVLGGEVERFEQAWSAFCGAKHAVGVASGTDAVAVALEALGIGAGDEVIVPANTCVPTVAGVLQTGATPVLADVDEETATLDPAAVEAAVTRSTRAVVAVHLYGRLADVDALRGVADAHGLKLLEDAAQAHGAERDGRRAGSLGDAAAFSFYPTKNLGALGDAGAVVTDNDAVAARARRLRVYGERARYESVEPGRNSRLDELQAAVLTAFLPELDAGNARRRSLAAAYRARLDRHGVDPLADDPGHAYHLFVVRTPERERLRAGLAERGIGTAVHYPRPVHEHPAYAHLARPGELRRSEALARTVLSLPLYPELRDDELEAVCVAVAEVAR